MTVANYYGQPGTGKSTLAVGRLLEYAAKGRRVAANFACDFAPASNRPGGKLAQASLTVLPARPSLADLEALGLGWHKASDRGREDICGLLVVDEAGGWLNSRTWNAPQRQAIIDWFLHSRKRGWDVILIAQHPQLLDKAVREACVELYGRCRRMDRFKVPILGVRLPRFHFCVVRYGSGPHDIVLERHMYRGGVEHRCFESYALFDTSDELVGGVYSTLPARLTKWRGYVSPWDVWRKRLAQFVRPERSARSLRPKLAHVARLQALPPEVRTRALHQMAGRLPLGAAA